MFLIKALWLTVKDDILQVKKKIDLKNIKKNLTQHSHVRYSVFNMLLLIDYYAIFAYQHISRDFLLKLFLTLER